jgi:hypothetical protein
VILVKAFFGPVEGVGAPTDGHRIPPSVSGHDKNRLPERQRQFFPLTVEKTAARIVTLFVIFVGNALTLRHSSLNLQGCENFD